MKITLAIRNTNPGAWVAFFPQFPNEKGIVYRQDREFSGSEFTSSPRSWATKTHPEKDYAKAVFNIKLEDLGSVKRGVV